MTTPHFLQLEPAGQCNLRCVMCAARYRQDAPTDGSPAFMGYTLFKEIIDQCPDLKELHLQGLGEPLMHPRFFDMVTYAARRGIRVTVNSNLTLLNSRRSEALVASGIAQIHVSVDGASADTYERIRVGASFAKLLHNMDLLTTARKGMLGVRPEVDMVIVAMRQNIHELAALVRLSSRWYIRNIFVQHLCHDFGEASLPENYQSMRSFADEQTLSREDQQRVERHFAEARAAANELGVALRLPRVKPPALAPAMSGRERCDWPWKGMYISYQGYAMPCCIIGTPDRATLGSVIEQGLEPLWNGAAYTEFRNKLDSDEPPGVCKSCSVYRHTF